MARAPETGFYFEPLTERLAMILEGSPFPSDDPWAWVGDPVEMSPELARLEVATRWPGVDPESLEIEFDTNFAQTVEEIERLQREEKEKEPGSGEIDFDVNFLLQQADALKAAAAQLKLPGGKDVEAALEEAAAQTVGDAIARAHEEAPPAAPRATSRRPEEG
jgi:hypothetical protein